MSIDYSSNTLGDITINGVVIHIVEQPYYNGTAWYAYAQNDAGNGYVIIWQTADNWNDYEIVLL